VNQLEQFLKKLEHTSDYFSDHASKYENLISISHDDADGISSSVIIQNLSKRMGKPCAVKIHNNITPWKQFLSTIPQLTDSSAIIMTDLGSNIKEIADAIKSNKISNDFIILDHHLYHADQVELFPENVQFVNLTEFGLNGLRDGSGSAITMQFALNVNQNCKSDAWISLLGITGDCLQHAQEYQGLNREILNLAVEENQVRLHEGLCVYGGSHMNLENGLPRSILPFIKKLRGSKTLCKTMLEKHGINPKLKIEEVDMETAQKIKEIFEEDMIGQTIKINKKSNLLNNAFEHGLLISILGERNSHQAFDLIGRKSAQTSEINSYLDYIDQLVGSLSKIIRLPRLETEDVILIDIGKELPYSAWSSTASYSSVNRIFNPEKIIMLGGLYNETDKVAKFSVRCSDDFLKKHKGKGVNIFIQQLAKKVAGRGGGHALAGGVNFSAEDFEKIKKEYTKYLKME
jgi:single-stranded DNA-specific DHH superfamily exonuclease